MSKDMARMYLDTSELREAVRRTSKVVEQSSYSFVRSASRYLVKFGAYETPIDTGRARAGWWPAVKSLGMTKAYTSYPDKGEGYAVNKTRDKFNPSFRFANNVPYITYIRGHGAWWKRATARAIGKVQKIEKAAMERKIKNGWRR